jgi:hypothetical protein
MPYFGARCWAAPFRQRVPLDYPGGMEREFHDYRNRHVQTYEAFANIVSHILFGSGTYIAVGQKCVRCLVST